eukprot:gene21198-biopygen16230
MVDRGAEANFKGNTYSVILDDKVMHIGRKDGILYKLNTEEITTAFLSCTHGGNDSIKWWHSRFSNLGYDNLKLLSNKSMVTGLNLDTKETFDRNCDGCTEVYFLEKKIEVLQKFKEFVVAVENPTGKRIKVIPTDNGGEYVSNEFKQFCIEHGIKRDATMPMTPQQNAVSERMNRTIMESAKSMLHHTKLPLYFCAEAVNTAVYIINSCPTVALDGKIPHEHWLGRRACCAFASLPDKVERASIATVDASKGYKLYDIERKVMIRSRDVRFLENDFDHLSTESENQEDYKELFHFGKAIKEFELCNEETESIIEHNEVADEDQPDVRRSTRMRTVPERPGTVAGDWWNDENLDFARITFTDYDEQSNYTEVIKSKHSSQWKDAITNEYESLKKNATWELVLLPKDDILISSNDSQMLEAEKKSLARRFKMQDLGDAKYCLVNIELMLSGYADADWASDAQSRESPSGYIFQLAGSTISWRSQKQSVVAF